MELYDWPKSGNAYKIRLFLSLLDRDVDLIPVNTTKGETRTSEFLKINPRGQIPVLVDDDVTVWDSQAILVYLARRYAEKWLPLEPDEMAEVMQWMAFAQNECLFGLARARAVKHFGRPFDFDECQRYGRAGMRVLDEHLAHREWLACDRPTIADVACFPYVGLAEEAEIPLDDHPNVKAWIRRVQDLPGYVGMEGIAPVSGSP